MRSITVFDLASILNLNDRAPLSLPRRSAGVCEAAAMAPAYWEVQPNPKVHEGEVELDDNIIAREISFYPFCYSPNTDY